MFDDRPIEVVDALDPEQNQLDIAKLTTFMDKKDDFAEAEDSCLDYMVVDNFIEFFQSSDTLSLECLQRCRSESETLANNGCLREAGFGRQQTLQVDKKVRSDTLMWLTSLLTD